MNSIKITVPIKKSSDVTRLSTSDLITHHSNIFKAFQDDNENKIDNGFTGVLSFLRNIPSFKEFYDTIPSKSKRFEVLLPKEIVEKLNKGDFSFINSGDNEFFAFIRNSKTKKIAHHLRIKEISNLKDSAEHIRAMHNIAVMQSMNQIVTILESIEKKLILIHKEFNNDRIGKIQAGFALFLDAKQIFDKDMKNKLLAESITLLVEGRAQLIESAKTRIENIETGFLNSALQEIKSWNFSDAQKANSKQLVKEIFFIQRSSQIILLAYNSINEYGAMIQSLAPLNDLMTFLNNEKNGVKLEEWESSQKWSNIFEHAQAAIEKLPAYETIGEKEIEIVINKVES